MTNKVAGWRTNSRGPNEDKKGTLSADPQRRRPEGKSALERTYCILCEAGEPLLLLLLCPVLADECVVQSVLNVHQHRNLKSKQEAGQGKRMCVSSETRRSLWRIAGLGMSHGEDAQQHHACQRALSGRTRNFASAETAR